MSENLEEILTREELETITRQVDSLGDVLSAISALPDGQLSRRIEGLVTIAPQEVSEENGEIEAFSPQILKPLGQGAMGEVYLARDPGLQRRVALKQLKKREQTPVRVTTRFISEAQITAQLDHPNIVPVYGLTHTEGKTVAYTMKLVKGRELAKVIEEARNLKTRKQPLPESLALQSRLEHFLKVCDAVHFAHVKGVIHRDLKPANIMLGEFHEVYVMDWGLAALVGTGAPNPDVGEDDDFVSASPERSAAGSVSGTILYMSPEQARGENLTLDAKSDQYTLGLILAELVYLQPARKGKSAIELLTKTAMGEPLSLSHVAGSKVPKELEAIIRRACAFNREDRYETVMELASDIRRHLAGNAVVALKDSLLARMLRWIGRHRMQTLLLCFGLTSAVCLALVWSLHHHNGMLKREELIQERSGKLVSSVASRAAEIEGHFLTVEKRLETIMIAAETLLAHSRSNPTPLLTVSDTQSTSPPTDLKQSSRYGMPVSIERPVTSIVVGEDMSRAETQLKTLSPINYYLQRTLLRSAKRRSTELDPDDAWETIGSKGTPIRWASIGLESGAAMFYPGHGKVPDDYDPRKSPWYSLGARTVGKHWGNPYMDLFGQGLLLPCASAIYSAAGEFLGVVSVDLTFEDIAKALMQISELDGFQEAFLLNEQGEILIRTSLPHKLSEYEGGSLKLQQFPYPVAFERMKNSSVGYVPVKSKGKTLWFAYSQIEIVGMYYVTVVDASAVLAH